MTLPLTGVSIEGYRSIRRIAFPVGHLTVLVGRNGVGKTNLYRALELVQAAARGTITRNIAREGGLDSVLWAGPRRRGSPVRLRLGAELGDLAYEIEIGLPAPAEAAISPTEPLVKAERLILRAAANPVLLMERKGPTVWLRDESGRRQTYEHAVLPSEMALSSFRDARRYAEADLVGRVLKDWRFYHAFRTDAASPMRQESLAVTTPILGTDGVDLAAALATVMVVRQEAPEVAAAVADAFPGARLDTPLDNGSVRLRLHLPDMPRPLAAHEFSDGTLAYLGLVAALCSYRLPPFIALNEPEASLHEELLAPLARLIARAAEGTQIWVVTHSQALAAAIEAAAGIAPRRVVREDGATWIEGLRLTGSFPDED